jgi:hypothetical protein
MFSCDLFVRSKKGGLRSKKGGSTNAHRLDAASGRLAPAFLFTSSSCLLFSQASSLPSSLAS